MKTHPFKPLIFENSRKLLIGTLPPETSPFYFSNSSNTRLWDILKSIHDKNHMISRNSIMLPNEKKINILESLSLGICDIIYKYDRTDFNSTRDKHIIPLQYSDIIGLIENTYINELLFVYKNAANWFLHSITGADPVQSNKLKSRLKYGTFKVLTINDKKITCSLLPSPLNRGKKGESLEYKLDYYRTEILKK
ncbi:hypothetical protein ACFLT1_09005 [Bacteroidota bacterium]